MLACLGRRHPRTLVSWRNRKNGHDVVGHDSYGLIGDIILGILGAVVGGFLAAGVFGIPDAVTGINLASIVIAFIGAIVVVAISRILPGRAPV